ncbi:MAG: sulfotransferase family 2 domain-containing protein [Crocosphaera sp.]
MTFISNSKKFIFVHPHKCAGTSIENALSRTLQWNDIILGSTPYGTKIETAYFEKFNLRKHSMASEIKEVIGEDTWNSYFTFSVVRHPFDRMVSLYKYLQKIKGKDSFIKNIQLKTKIYLYRNKQISFLNQHPLIQKDGIHKWPAIAALTESKNFSEFIVAVTKTNSSAAKPQYYGLSDRNHSQVLVNYVAKVETLEEDWQYICDQLKISQKLPHVNKSRKNNKNWRDYYTAEDIKFMIETYQVDLDQFNYSV